ncbi:MAG: sugar phosphate isomerase/epimerase [Planctomycetes bacterium]|nr:sugar phosphate isomerase/epimerase [Planctomycetota bacterium]
MKVSCFTNSYGRFGAQAALRRLASAGIAHLELPIRTAGAPTFFGDVPLVTTASTDVEFDATLESIKRAELSLSSCNVTSGNPLEADVLEATLRKLAIARRLGVNLVVGGAGEAASNSDRARLFDHLRRIGDAAGEFGIVYCFETHPGLCRSPDGMLACVERLDHPQLALNFDTGNVLYYNAGADVAEALALVRSHVRHVHLKDTNGRPGDWHFPALGRGGAVDFRRVRELLDEVRFRGPYSLEIEGIEGEPPLSEDEHHQRIVESVGHLQRCGYAV